MSDTQSAIPEVEITIGGRKFLIRCSFGLLIRFEKATGLNPFDFTIWEKPTPWLLAAVLWAGCVKEDSTLTIESIAENMRVSEARQAHEIIRAMVGQQSQDAQELPVEVEEKKTE
jgi:hypothetical protein